MRRHAAFFAIFFTAAALIMSVGAFFLVWGSVEAWRGHASLSWPTVPGVVVDARVTESSRRSGTGRRGGSRTTEWIPQVRYEYEVDGVRHESNRVDFMTRAEGRDAALDEVSGLEPGAVVTVHHHPDDASLAVLRPGNGPWDWIPPVMGLFGLAVPPLLFLLARRWVRIAERAEKVQARRGDRAGGKSTRPAPRPER